jgi:hypothetical protein
MLSLFETKEGASPIETVSTAIVPVFQEKLLLRQGVPESQETPTSYIALVNRLKPFGVRRHRSGGIPEVCASRGLGSYGRIFRLEVEHRISVERRRETLAVPAGENLTGAFDGAGRRTKPFITVGSRLKAYIEATRVGLVDQVFASAAYEAERG